MITLYGWGPMFDCPSPSPYVMKTIVQLQMLGVEFDCAMADLETVSKHKAPYVDDGGTLIQDSNFIRSHFEKKLGKSLDASLSVSEKATGWALERMAEGHLTKCMAAQRWMKDDNFFKGPAQFFAHVPADARDQVIADVREQIAAGGVAEGFGRHTEAEQLDLAARDIEAIRLHLGDQDYLFGSSPTGPDAAVSAVLISAATEFFDSPLTDMIRKHETLVGYMDRMTKAYFTSVRWPVPEMA